MLLVKTKCNRRRREPSDLAQPSGKSNCSLIGAPDGTICRRLSWVSWWCKSTSNDGALLLEISVKGGSGIYCDTLSVSQYDSKVRSDLTMVETFPIKEKRFNQRRSLNNLFIKSTMFKMKNDPMYSHERERYTHTLACLQGNAVVAIFISHTCNKCMCVRWWYATLYCLAGIFSPSRKNTVCCKKWISTW